MDIAHWVSHARALGASDVLLESDTPVVVRVHGEVQAIGDVIQHDALEKSARALIGNKAWQQFESRHSFDQSLMLRDGRCRINVYRTLRGVALALRLLSPAVNDVRGANLHPSLSRFTQQLTGLLIISGPTGSGKSTTLASLVEEINRTRACNIITLESPVEYLHTNRNSFVRQREIPTHSPSYEQAIVDALRESPDVLVIGEMRTPDVMRLTLNAAETGHLVVTTMHSATCAEALTRLCMSFPSDIQTSVRAQVADCLVGVVCQRLEYLPAYRIRVPKCEILTATSASRGTVRLGQFSHIPTVLQSSGEDGMWTFDRYERWIAQKNDWSFGEKTPGDGSDGESRRASQAPASAKPIPREVQPTFDLEIDEEMDMHEIAKRIDERKR